MNEAKDRRLAKHYSFYLIFMAILWHLAIPITSRHAS
jgi:hypothetical protein